VERAQSRLKLARAVTGTSDNNCSSEQAHCTTERGRRTCEIFAGRPPIFFAQAAKRRVFEGASPRLLYSPRNLKHREATSFKMNMSAARRLRLKAEREGREKLKVEKAES
jgi:hypothetical protein